MLITDDIMDQVELYLEFDMYININIVIFNTINEKT